MRKASNMPEVVAITEEPADMERATAQATRSTEMRIVLGTIGTVAPNV